MWKIRHIGYLLAIALLTASCDEESVGKSELNTAGAIDSTRTSLLNVSGKLFSIPSPIQTALLIKKSGSAYYRKSLSETRDVSSLVSNNEKALCLGMYGTDMAYASLFEDGQQSLSYYKALQTLTDELEIQGAFDADLLKRLGKNVANADSLLYISGSFYQDADAYLKGNDRYDIAALVLTGGWVEASYLTAMAAANGNDAARDRLAVQKESIATLCDVLGMTANDAFKNGKVMAELDSINTLFKDVNYSYTYEKPVVNVEAKLTKITSKCSYTFEDELFTELKTRIDRVRAELIPIQ